MQQAVSTTMTISWARYLHESASASILRLWFGPLFGVCDVRRFKSPTLEAKVSYVPISHFLISHFAQASHERGTIYFHSSFVLIFLISMRLSLIIFLLYVALDCYVSYAVSIQETC